MAHHARRAARRRQLEAASARLHARQLLLLHAARDELKSPGADESASLPHARRMPLRRAMTLTACATVINFYINFDTMTPI